MLQRWGRCVLAASFLLLVVSLMFQLTTSQSEYSRPIQNVVEALYWALVSVTTIGGGSGGTKEEGVKTDKSATELVGTMIYGFLGVTSLAVFWGNYSRLLLQRYKTHQKHQKDDRQGEVLGAFCDDIKAPHAMMGQVRRSSSTRSSIASPPPSLKTERKQDTSASFYWRMAKIWSVPAAVFILALTLGEVSGWSLLESFYYAVITAFTMSDDVIAPNTTLSKLVAMVLIPLALALTARWLLVVAQWIETMENSRTPIKADQTPDNSMSAQDVAGLLETAKMDDGLLTRADFLEVMLLAMKAVEPDLLLELRKGFDRVTHDGSIDLTRKEWIEAAAQAMERSQQKRQKHQQLEHAAATKPLLPETTSPAFQHVSDWLLGVDRPSAQEVSLSEGQSNGSASTTTAVEV